MELEKQRVGGMFAKYVTLNIFGMVGYSCYILADTYFVAARLGATGLAALNFAISVYGILNASGLLIAVGGATEYQLSRAKGEEKRANDSFKSALVLGLFVGLAFLLVGLLCSRQLASLLGAAGDALELTEAYLRTILSFAPFFVCNNVVQAFVRNDGAPRLAMAAMLAGSLLNIVLDWVFLFPLNMGMFGAALATGIAPAVGLLVLSFHSRSPHRTLALGKGRPSLRLFAFIGKLGASAFVTEASSGVALVVFNLLIVSLAGNDGVAAYGVVANLSLVAISIFTGIAQGCQPLVSRFWGEKKMGIVKQVEKYALLLSLGLSAGIYAVVFFCAPGLVGLFNGQGNQAVEALGTQGLRLYFLGIPFAGVNVVLAAFFASCAQGGKGFLISVLRGVVLLVPLALLLAQLLAVTGVWLSFPAAELLTTVGAILLLARFISSRSTALQEEQPIEHKTI